MTIDPLEPELVMRVPGTPCDRCGARALELLTRLEWVSPDGWSPADASVKTVTRRRSYLRCGVDLGGCGAESRGQPTLESEDDRTTNQEGENGGSGTTNANTRGLPT